MAANTQAQVKEILKTEFDLQESDLTDENPLIEGGLIDSIGTLRLVDDLERVFNIQFKPHEITKENLGSVARITRFIESKQ